MVVTVICEGELHCRLRRSRLLLAQSCETKQIVVHMAFFVLKSPTHWHLETMDSIFAQRENTNRVTN